MDIKYSKSQRFQELPEISPPQPPQAISIDYITYYHWDPYSRRTWTITFNNEKCRAQLGMRAPTGTSIFTLSQSLLPCPQLCNPMQTPEDWPHQEATFHWPSAGRNSNTWDSRVLRPYYPRAVKHSHSDRHHGYQIEDIGIHDWQQSTPSLRTTSYRIYN